MWRSKRPEMCASGPVIHILWVTGWQPLGSLRCEDLFCAHGHDIGASSFVFCLSSLWVVHCAFKTTAVNSTILVGYNKSVVLRLTTPIEYIPEFCLYAWMKSLSQGSPILFGNLKQQCWGVLWTENWSATLLANIPPRLSWWTFCFTALSQLPGLLNVINCSIRVRTENYGFMVSFAWVLKTDLEMLSVLFISISYPSFFSVQASLPTSLNFSLLLLLLITMVQDR